MRIRTTILALLVASCGFSATFAATYFVATDGDDANSGSFASPFGTVHHAVSVASSGDTIFLRGGIYYLERTLRIDGASGSPTARTSLLAWQDEVAILDAGRFSIFDPDFGDNSVIRHTAGYWHLRGLTLRNAPAFGIRVIGANAQGNILESLRVHGNGETGIDLIGGPSDTLVLNCDSYENFDPHNGGENADGFTAKFDIGTGNVFRGCRAWANSDDGFDFWHANNAVTVESSWAFENGFDIWNHGTGFTGNGNGFKLGQQGGAHLLRNCLAWNHPQRGFDSNGNTTGVTLEHCTGWNNGTDFGFGSNDVNHVIRNCVAGGNVWMSASTDDAGNSWTLPVTVTDGDFLSTDDRFARSTRQANGSLPESDFLRLAPSSDLIDQGIQLGTPFTGGAPDLGAYEHGTPIHESHWIETELPLSSGAPMQISSDVEAANAGYIATPEGDGNNGFATYEVEIATAGDYRIWGRVTAPDGLSDSFFVRVDGGTAMLWDIPNTTSWEWDPVSDRGVQDPVVLTLSSGSHTLRIETREDGTLIDKLLLTNDPALVPQGFGPRAENLPTPASAGNIGNTLSVDRAVVDGDVTLTWSDSCVGDDDDFAIYEGVIGPPFSSHSIQSCSTSGATSATFTPGRASHYYLVTPRNADGADGSYGVTSEPADRFTGVGTCGVREIAVCP